MNVLALDLSLTCTGWAAQIAGRPLAVDTFTPAGTGVARLADARRWVDVLVADLRPDLALIEGYSYNSVYSHANAIGELGGVVRLRFFDHGIPVVDVPPAVRAKLATGKGNAGKPAVLVAAVRRMGYTGHSEDEADALWLLEAARQAYLLPGHLELPETHRAALDKLTFPRMGVAAA